MTATKNTFRHITKNLKYSPANAKPIADVTAIYSCTEKGKYGFIAISAPKQASEAQK